VSDTTERRLELLNMEGLGFSRSEIVKMATVTDSGQGGLPCHKPVNSLYNTALKRIFYL
jgi:hypothetical protein